MEKFVALVGRPNVGKSTLFNCILGYKKSITHKQAGTTLDTLYGTVVVGDKQYTIADCPGVFEEFSDQLNIAAQERALNIFQKAALLIFVVDSTLPPNKEDRDALRWLRKHNLPFLVCATKADSKQSIENIGLIERLVGQAAIPVAALQGSGVTELNKVILEYLSKHDVLTEKTESPEKKAIKIALLGRPNAGKSTLFNYLAGEELSLVTNIPGTTRDPIDIICQYPEMDMAIQWIDTAGLRRRAKIDDNLEYISYLRSHKVIERCDIAVLLISAENMIVHRDETIIQYILENQKALIVAVTKTDLLTSLELKKFEGELAYTLQYAKWAPVVQLAVEKKGKGVKDLLSQIKTVYDQNHRQISTQQINKFIEHFQSLFTAPLVKGKRAKMYYGLQTDSAPPHFLIFVNDEEVFRFGHVRAIENYLRKYFELTGTPIKIEYRSRREKSED